MGFASFCIGQDDRKSASYGNTFIHNQGEMVVFGLHDFDNGGFGILPGMIGTEREYERGRFSFGTGSQGWTNANNEKYVDGYVKVYHEEGFTFPIGDNGYFRPIAISGAPETSAAYFRADPSYARTSSLFGGEYSPLPEGGPFNRFALDPILEAVSPVEYWDINGQEPTEITLTWDLNSEIGELTNYNINNITIVGWDGDSWEPIPSTVDLLHLTTGKSAREFFGGISSLTQGSITTDEPIVPDEYSAYAIGSLALAIIGNQVWEDLNRNGIQEINEPGIAGVVVKLQNTNGIVIDETITDLGGKYYFSNIVPGIYQLHFETPDHYTVTLPGRGLPALNSDISFTGYTQNIVILGNEVDYTIDAGYYKTATIGDFVWLDANENGIQEIGEPTLPNVQVELLNGDEILLASTFTDSSGFYEFRNLPPADYIIRFVAPLNYGFSPVQATSDETIDSDADPSTGMSPVITVISGEQVNDIDAGLSSPCSFTADLYTTEENCRDADGTALLVVQGSTAPFTYQWSNGASTPGISGLSAGSYSVTITDMQDCQMIFNFTIESNGQCPMVCVDLQTSVFLEGAFNYDHVNMNVGLNELGYLPGQIPVTFFGKYTQPGQPYDEIPWFYEGEEGEDYLITEKLNNNQFYPADAVDWVLVSLRSHEDQEYETCTRAGLLMNDGTIEFDPEDCCLVDTTKSYYVVVEHRNHLIVMSPEPILPSDSLIAFDFTTNQSYVKLLGYGQKEVSPGIFAMYGANGDQYQESVSPVDINVSDLAEWLKENGFHSSYYNMDFDLNGDANVQDKGLYLKNIGIFTDVPKD